MFFKQSSTLKAGKNSSADLLVSNKDVYGAAANKAAFGSKNLVN